MNVYEVRVTIRSETPIFADDWVNEVLGDRLLDSDVEMIEVELISEKEEEEQRGGDYATNR